MKSPLDLDAVGRTEFASFCMKVECFTMMNASEHSSVCVCVCVFVCVCVCVCVCVQDRVRTHHQSKMVPVRPLVEKGVL